MSGRENADGRRIDLRFSTFPVEASKEAVQKVWLPVSLDSQAGEVSIGRGGKLMQLPHFPVAGLMVFAVVPPRGDTQCTSKLIFV
jgi:hypothetical protein